MGSKHAPEVFKWMLIAYFVYEILFIIASILFFGYDMSAGISIVEYVHSNGGLLSMPIVIMHSALRLSALIGLLYYQRWGANCMFAAVGLSMLELYAGGMTHRIAFDIFYGYLAYWMICELDSVETPDRACRKHKRKYVEAVIELPAQAA
ncbi:MAG: hypothetical protein KDD66_00670 [Bdellovibrionales bacterium]|nr:hypothetical protein [Bdellovibrionales bacterium]